MKLFKKIRKGFTLIELVVVIAVIAILTTVAVIAFTSVTTKAKESNDHMIIDQINLALKGDALLNKKTTVHRLVENLVEEEGFDVRYLKPEVKDAKFVYSYENHMFGYLQNNKVTYPKSLEGTPISSDLWLMLDLKGNSSKHVDLTTGEYKEFSCYARSLDNVETIKTKEGFDVGKTSGITSIEYVNSEAQSVIIRTNSAKTSLSVEAPNDTVNHYDAMGGLNIIAVDTASYHEHGTVAFAEISTGRLVLESTSDVDHIHINKKANEEAFDEVIIEDKGTSELPNTISRDQVDVSSATPVVTVKQNGSTETVYVYPYEDSSNVKTGTTEKTGTQNPGITSALGQLVLDTEFDAGEKAMSNNEKAETKEAIIDDAVAEEERAEAAEHGVCIHNWQTVEVTTPATCLTGGEELQQCSICHEYNVAYIAPLGHELIGTYCNRCQHPIAFIDEIDDFTLNDSAHRKLQVATVFEYASELLNPTYPAYLNLDVAYSFKAFEDINNQELDDTKSYNLDLQLGKFIEVNPGEGMFSAQDIYDYFGSWECDYYVSFSKSVMPFTCGLGGQYDSYSDEGIGFLVPPLNGMGQPIEARQEVPLLQSMLGVGLTYENVSQYVSEFKCGFFNLSEDNIGTKFIVKLCMINPHRENTFDDLFDDIIDVAVTEYTIGAPSESNLQIAQQYLIDHPELAPILNPTA